MCICIYIWMLLRFLGFFRVRSKFFSRFCNIFPGFCPKTPCFSRFSRYGPIFPGFLGFPGAVGTLKELQTPLWYAGDVLCARGPQHMQWTLCGTKRPSTTKQFSKLSFHAVPPWTDQSHVATCAMLNSNAASSYSCICISSEKLDCFKVRGHYFSCQRPFSNCHRAMQLCVELLPLSEPPISVGYAKDVLLSQTNFYG